MHDNEFLIWQFQKLINNDGKYGLERKWLFHGTDSSSASKIANHGFNRSFAKTTAYGKGVYFAVNSSYSCHPHYAKPDRQGVQRVLLCRVMVGDWCLPLSWSFPIAL